MVILYIENDGLFFLYREILNMIKVSIIIGIGL